MLSRARPTMLLLCCALAWVVGCTQDARSGRDVLTVLAASSLTEAFRSLEEGFEARHPGLDVQLVLAGSQILRLQLEQGLSAGVFASANTAHMQALADGALVIEDYELARNPLALVVPEDNPAGIEGWGDLGRTRRLVIGNEQTPIGAYTRRLFEMTEERRGAELANAIRAAVASEEGNVRLVRAKVELGEADAAIVYRSDALSSSRVREVPLPADLRVEALYRIGLVRSEEAASSASDFVRYALSADGQARMAAHGFMAGDE